jgi:hypothetical protein
MNVTPGYKFLMFDDGLESPIRLPPGTWNMKDVTWTGTLRDTGTPVPYSVVEVPEGCVFTRLRYIAGPLIVRNLASKTPPVSDIVGGEGDQFACGLGLPGALVPICQNMGAAPFIDVSRIGPGQIAEFHSFAAIGGGVSVSPFFRNNGPGNFFLGIANRLDDDMLGGEGPGVFIVARALPIGEIGQQTKYAGHIDRTFYSVNRSNYGLNPMTPMPPAGAPVPARLNDLLRLDPSAGPIAQELPDIVGQASVLSPKLHIDSRGMTVIVKNMGSANDVRVSAVAGQTIDGRAEAIAVGPGAAGMFVSDGVSNWIRVV